MKNSERYDEYEVIMAHFKERVQYIVDIKQVYWNLDRNLFCMLSMFLDSFATRTVTYPDTEKFPSIRAWKKELRKQAKNAQWVYDHPTWATRDSKEYKKYTRKHRAVLQFLEKHGHHLWY